MVDALGRRPEDLLADAFVEVGENLGDVLLCPWVEAGRVREVGLEHHVVFADLRYCGARSEVLEPERGEDLPAEVLRRLHRQALALGRHRLLELVVHRLEQERHPADARLHGDEVDLRIALTEAAEDQVHDHLEVGDEQADRDHRQSPLRTIARPNQLVGDAGACADVEVDRHLHILASIPERVPGRIAEVRQTKGFRCVAHRDPGHAEILNPLQFLNRCGDVPERNQALWEQPAGAFLLELGDRVVVDGAADVAQFGVLDLDEVLRAETGDVRVHDLLGDAELVEQFQPSLRFGRRLAHLVERGQRNRAVFLLTIVTNHRETGRAKVDIVEHLPALLAFIVDHDVRHCVLVLGRRARGPEVGRLSVVRVDVDDRNAVHGERHEGLLLLIRDFTPACYRV